jgi:hypothetical protein
MNLQTSTCTITFGDRAENHKGMQMIGNIVNAGNGFNIDDLENMRYMWEDMGAVCEMYNLRRTAGIDAIASSASVEDAYVLVIRNAMGVLELNPTEMFMEQSDLDHDKKAFMYGRVVEKRARWNVCFGEESQEPEYELKKGRIVAWSQVPLLREFREVMPDIFGPKAEGLYGEGNYYYNVRKCGIGFHGDGERRKVIALRLGASMDIHYQWYFKSAPQGKRIVIPLGHGDVYVMSEKAVGTDWKCRNRYTLRHAAGCKTFTT